MLADLNGRRAQILGLEATPGGTQTIHAEVPLAEMFGYATGLRSLTKGRASYSMEPLNFQRVPENILAAIMAKNAAPAPARQGQEKKK